MTEHPSSAPHPRNAQEFLARMDDDLQFMHDFALNAGDYMATARLEALINEKLDHTVVTDVDKIINRDYIDQIRERSGDDATVLGEEESASGDVALLEELEEVWIVDPIDGTGEYVDASIPDEARTSCVGVAKLKRGQPHLAVVRNPFRDETFLADRALKMVILNGTPLKLADTPLGTAPFSTDLPFDFIHWEGAPTDARFLEEIMDSAPIGSYSAINQACDVARGRSAFAVFPGDTIHDIAAGALIVELAGGVVTDINGDPLDWNNLNGVVYAANPQIHAHVTSMIRTGQK